MRRFLPVLSLVFLVVAGCSGARTGGAIDPKIVEAQKQLPFKLVLPGYLPAGYQLADVQLDDEDPVDPMMAVDLFYENGATGSFNVQESNDAAHLDGNDIERINVGNKDGEYQEIKRADATQRSVAFHATDQVSVTIYTLSLDREELLKVAASLVK